MMQFVQVTYLSPDEENLINLLENVGISSNVARILVYLANVPGSASHDIERGADLPQPIVSQTLSLMRKNDWVEYSDLRANPNGRPSRIYRLSRPFPEIVNDIGRMSKKGYHNRWRS